MNNTLATPPRETSPRKLTVMERLGLGIGGIPDLAMQYAIGNLVYPIFNICYGVSPILISISMSLPRIWELIFDPWMGVASDRTRGPWGRRHPYILAGGILGGLTFMLLWWVPSSWSPEAKGIWLIVLTLLHFTGYSIFMVPYAALLGEISSDPQERLRNMAYRIAFVNVSACAMGWLYWLSQVQWFGSQSPEQGMKTVGIIFGLFIIMTAWVPTLVCKDSRKFHASGVDAEAKLQEFAVLRELWEMKSFRFILLATVTIMCGFLVSSLGFYVMLYYGFRGDTAAAAKLTGISATTVTVFSLLACQLVSYIGRKIGQWRALFCFIPFCIAGSLGTWFALRPEHPYAMIACTVLSNLGQNGFWILVPSLIGQISHDYELKTGKAISGSFFALHGIAIKIGSSGSLLFTGFILNFTGFHVARGIDQLPGVLTNMRLLNASVPALAAILTLWFLWKAKVITEKDEEHLADPLPVRNLEI